ncbi:MAG: hypothetical protein IK062_06050 [Selenomonadaceae bacterium]|nr:hypothetical protein [Selenomonadaceae bacterium]
MNNFLDDKNASYDALAKKFLSRKAILAQILKNSVKEFADCSLEEIEQKYIEGDPSLTINTVPLDDTFYIKGKNAESKSPTEGLVTFDIIFDAILPTDGETAKFIINVEPQKTTKKINYKLMKRAVYYAARLISAQKETEFKNDDYNKLKKIFSIWVCMDVQNYRADSIQEYRLTEKIVHGNFHDDLNNYDLMTIIILNLGENSTTHKLLNLLHLIFMDLKSSEEKSKILHDDYQIELSRDMKEELEKMGGLMEPLLNIAKKQAAKQAAEQAAAETKIKVAAETEKNTLIKNIRSLMKTLNLTAQQAMDALQISADKQKEFISLI